MTIDWSVKKFDELTPHELYAVLQLRNEVFVVEQNCVFQDADDNDQVAFHFMGWSDKKLLAYTRLLGPGITYPEASIGRVVSSPFARGSGIGKELMQKSIEAIYKIYGRQNIQIGAQLYLKKFYETFSFHQTGEVYLEDGIEHIHMLKNAAS